MLANKILCGDALQTLRTLPSESVHCIVTSPPYYALRDYGVDGQIGLEETPAAYVAKLVEVFREARRVLRHDGTLWLNIGDSYANDTKWGGSTGGKHVEALHGDNAMRNRRYTGLAPKNLMMIPARLAIALQDDEWILRSDIIWHKLNAMPESVTDRPTNAHEHLFLLAKNERYFYDADGIREERTDFTIHKNVGRGSQGYAKASGIFSNPQRDSNGGLGVHPAGRNKRNVWPIASQPYSESHFATMPPKLIEPCILAGTSPQTCEYCGAPWERLTERTPMIIRNGPKSGGYGSRTTDGLSGTMVAPAETKTVGWQPTCSHANEGTGKAVVLDPFMGAGTVALVSIRLQRDYLGIELNPAYVELIEKRIAEVQPTLWAGGVA